MTNDSSVQDNRWPVPKFYFSVQFGPQSNTIPFLEISGLDIETQIIEYRHGNSKTFSTVKMPGIAKPTNVTLKKGAVAKDNSFFEWYESVRMNTIKRDTVIIRLLDEGGSPVMTWTLTNAFPTKISILDLKSDSNEVAIETLELAHEGITIANARK
ncbi:MAG: phage tail protein [Bacteroidota bacterium]